MARVLVKSNVSHDLVLDLLLEVYFREIVLEHSVMIQVDVVTSMRFGSVSTFYLACLYVAIAPYAKQS